VITWTRCRSVELDGATRTALHELWHAAFGGGFSAEDADHAFGGVHVVARDGERLAAHASVVPRSLRIGDREIDAGYVEAAATAPSDQGRGLGTHALRLLASAASRSSCGRIPVDPPTRSFQRHRPGHDRFLASLRRGSGKLGDG
jgi:aminoglycoside 2'-N-acetyltransferase I